MTTGYNNLKAEMVRYNVTRYDIADTLKISYSTVCKKVNGTRDFTLNEAILLQEKLFSECDVVELFQKTEKEPN